ncbi:MAG: ribonuclease HI family protein [Candidatus Nanohaloarchaea archaeon]|nr:ribonuclease HI family protein [Candidatus Nanohaloarchaea archaeon]
MSDPSLDTDDVVIYTDGASRGNPGPASYGFVLTDGDEVLYTESGFLGRSTNNQAEYNAVINALRTAIDAGVDSVKLFSDSQLLVNQLNGEWKVKDAELRELYDTVQELLDEIDVAFTHVPRENRFVDLADTLCNEKLDEEGH